MKTALLHYWLTNMRGGEKVLAELCAMLPGADVFTHAFLPTKLAPPLSELQRVRESFIARLPLGRRHPQLYLPLMMSAARRLDLSGYDLIVSSESGPIKGVVKPSRARHVCYCHTPMRYVWDMYADYYAAAGLAGKVAMRLFTPYLRRMDLKSAESVDEFIANSQFVAERIRRIYGREATVVYPPVDTAFFGASPLADAAEAAEKPYYLFVGAAAGYKRRDLATAACARLGRELKCVGGGSHSDVELRALYAGARALLFPGVEDFGIVPVEAQAAGCPVIAFGKGGALETVADGETGLFFREPTVDSLCEAMLEFERRDWSRQKCRVNAEKFSAAAFRRAMAAKLRG